MHRYLDSIIHVLNAFSDNDGSILNCDDLTEYIWLKAVDNHMINPRT